MMDAAPQDQEQQFQQPEAEADELEMEEKRIVIVRPPQFPVFIYLKGMALLTGIRIASRCYRNCCFVPV